MKKQWLRFILIIVALGTFTAPLPAEGELSHAAVVAAIGFSVGSFLSKLLFKYYGISIDILPPQKQDASK